MKKALSHFSFRKMISAVLIASTVLTFALPTVVVLGQSSYSTYKELFTPGSGITTVSYGINSEQKKISSIDFNINWSFPVTEQNTAEIFWNHIDDKERTLPPAFLIRVCNPDSDGNPIPSTCFVGRPPYYKALLDSNFTNYNKTSFFKQGPSGYYTKEGNIKVSIVNLFDPNDVSIGASVSTLELNGTTNTFDLWYCAADSRNENTPINAYSNNGGVDSLINQFKGFCGGHSYFKIGNTVTKARPSSIAQAVREQTLPPTPTGTITQDISDKFPTCHILNGLMIGKGSIMGCVAFLVYYGLFIPASAFAWLMGQLFDFFIGFSINDEAYRLGFLSSGWALVRDISNIFFIIILIYTALSAVFGISKVSYKKVVPQLIFNAILINFSLLGVRVLVDMSNIVGRLFYNNVTVTDTQTKESKTGATGYTPVSEAIISAFNPQKIFDASSLNKSDSTNVGGNVIKKNNDAFITTTENKIKSDNINSIEYGSYYSLISLAAAILIFMVGLMFWNVTFMFLGRLIGIYMAMIFAPFAIMSRTMPGLTAFKVIGWGEWQKNLINYLLLAPVFLLFLFLINAVLKPLFFSTFVRVEGSGFFATLLSIVIPMIMIYFLLKEGEKIAKKYAGEMGNLVNEWGKKATGFVGGAALGVATGGLAMAGRGLIGRGARSLQQKDSWINRNLEKKSFAGSLARSANSKINNAQTASFDLRQSSFVKSQSKNLSKLGLNMNADNKLVNALNIGTKYTAGGLEGYEDRKKKEFDKNIEKVKTNFKDDKDAEKFYNNTVLAVEHKKLLKELNKEKDNKNSLEAEAKEALRKENIALTEENITTEIAKQKEKIEKKITDNKEFVDFQKNQEKEYGKVKDNKTLTQAMRLRYADNIKNDNTSFSSLVRSIAGAGIPVLTGDSFLEEEVRAKNAEKYGKDVRKSFTNVEKQEKELEGIHKTLNEMLIEMKEVDPGNFNKDEFKNSKGEWDHKEMDGDTRHNMIKGYKTHLQDELEVREAKLEQVKQKVRTFDTTHLNNAEKEYNAAVAQGDQLLEKMAKTKLDALKNEQTALLATQQKAIKDKNEIREKIDEAKTVESRYQSKTKDKEDKERRESEKKDKTKPDTKDDKKDTPGDDKSKKS